MRNQIVTRSIFTVAMSFIAISCFFSNMVGASDSCSSIFQYEKTQDRVASLFDASKSFDEIIGSLNSSQPKKNRPRPIELNNQRFEEAYILRSFFPDHSVTFGMALLSKPKESQLALVVTARDILVWDGGLKQIIALLWIETRRSNFKTQDLTDLGLLFGRLINELGTSNQSLPIERTTLVNSPKKLRDHEAYIIEIPERLISSKLYDQIFKFSQNAGPQ